MNKPMKIDEFLSSQGSGYTAILERIPGKDTHVKITPYRGGSNCACAASFSLAKHFIESVTPTDTSYFYCGKRLEVVLVTFAKDASIPVTEVFEPSPAPTVEPAPAFD
jgi:hypothetical protein